MSLATTVAKSKRKSVPDSATPDQVRIIVSLGFKDWLKRYAEHRQLSMTDTIVQDLIRGAKAEGFEPPPKR